jgi:hypothetical protein
MKPPRTSLEDELTEALADDDVPGALEALVGRHAGDQRAADQIRRVRRLVERLREMGSAIDAVPLAPPKAADLPVRSPLRAWPAATVAAAAAIVLLAVLIPSGRYTTVAPSDRPELAAATAPVESVWSTGLSAAAGFEMTSPGELEWPTLEIPSLSAPSPVEMDTTFSVPTFTWPSFSERSESNET